MQPEELCERLIQTSDPAERASLLDEAASRSECLPVLLNTARSATSKTPRAAVEIADLTVAVAERAQAPREAAMAWRVRAQALRVLGRHEEAITAFVSAASSAGRAGDGRLAAQVQIGRIDSLGFLGRYDEAIALARRLERALRQENAPEDAAKVLVNLGSLHFRRDRYAAALNCYEQAGEILARQDDPATLAVLQTNRALILTHLHRADEALALYEQARAAFTAQEMAREAAVVDTNIGFLSYMTGRYSTALAALNRAYQEFSRLEYALEAAKCDVDRGDVYRALNLLPESRDCYARAIQQSEMSPLVYERARAELGQAAALMADKETEEALLALERAEASFQFQKNALQRAHVRLVRGYLLRSVGRTEEAAQEARQAAYTLARHHLPGWAAEARYLLAEIALESGQDARRRLHAIRRAARRQARGWLESRAERALGLDYARRANLPRALRHLRAGVAALEAARTLVTAEEMHVAFLRDKLAVYEDLVGVLLARGRRRDLEEALEIVERSKSRLLLERIQSAVEGLPASSHPATAQARARLAALRADLNLGYHSVRFFDEGDPRRLTSTQALEALAPLEHSYKELLREIELTEREAGPAFYAQMAAVTADQLQKVLNPDEALVEYYIARGKVCVFVIGPEGMQAREGTVEVSEVAQAARRLRYYLQKSGSQPDYANRHARLLQEGAQDALGQLYTLLLRPLEDLVPPRIVLVPHGILHGLPFHAFFDGAQHALDRWEFVYAPSAAVWAAGRQRRPGRWTEEDTLILGIPAPGIERVAEEVERLADLIPGATVYRSEQATLDSFHACAPYYRRLHLATHALYRPDNPLFSGLRFADGWLLARDLYEMRLDCELATLSACHTGVTYIEPGDELFGLLRGFLAAGVRSVAASFWPADDTATSHVMVYFYGLLARGMGRAAALRAAQQETRKHYPNPYHWAAFALIGER